ncbi:MAG: response regulator [Acidobacteriota bacterium]
MPYVLVVDDEVSVRESLKALLEAEGHTVEECANGAEALERIHRRPPDLIMLDLVMPGISGETLAGMLKGEESTRLIPIIVLTGERDRQTHLQLLDTGVDEFLSKPFSRPQLLARVRSLLRMKALNDQLLHSFRTVEALENFNVGLIRRLDEDPLMDPSDFVGLALKRTFEAASAADLPSHVLVCQDAGAAYNGTLLIYGHEGRVDQQPVSLDKGKLLAALEPYRQTKSMYWADHVPSEVLKSVWPAIPVSSAIVGTREETFCLFAGGYRRSVGVHDARWLSSMARQYAVFQRHLAQVRATERAFVYTMEALARAAEIYDSDTSAHIRRVNLYCGAISEYLGCTADFIRKIRVSAMMHDVGKIHIDIRILRKPGRLNEEERRAMQQHPIYGARILGDSPRLAMAREIALCHHEFWDGTGYPRGLSGEEIPLSARIVTVADVYDALRSARPYKRAFSHEEAFRIILEGDKRTDPGQFDPMCLRAFKALGPEMDRIFESNQEESFDAVAGGRKLQV